MPTLSVCMIVKNEQENLQKTLESIKDLADEIIIVDTGSTDTTKEIASFFTDKIFDFTWCDDFSKARNESLKHATGDWILILDADETINKRDIPRIRNLIETVPQDHMALTLIQRNYTNHSHIANWVSKHGDGYDENEMASGWIPNVSVRLFRNNMGFEFEGIVHETVTGSVMKKGKIAHTVLPIHHSGHVNDDVFTKKTTYYEKLLHKKAESRKDYASYYELGRELFTHGKFDEAIEYLNLSTSLNPDFFDSWFVLGNIYQTKGDKEKALEMYQKSKIVNPGNPTVHLAIGIMLMNMKNFKDAHLAIFESLKRNPRNAKAHFEMGVCLNEMGRKDKAYVAFKNAIKYDPSYAKKVKLE